MDLQNFERLLFIRPGALGDTLLLMPTLALARQRWPAIDTTLVSREDVAQLALACGWADHISPYGSVCWSSIFAESREAAGRGNELRKLTQGSAVVAWLADPDGTVQHNLRCLGAEPIILARGRPDPSITEHMAVTLARGLEPLGLMIPLAHEGLSLCMPYLPTANSDMSKVTELWQSLNIGRRRVAAFHVGSGGAAKRWPPQSFAWLAEESARHGLVPVLIAGPQDEDSTQAVIAACSAIPHPPVVNDLSLGQLSALLQRVAAYTGNDSGVTHLAALAGAPTLALFGPTNPAYWAPLGRQVHILRSPTGQMADISKTAAWEALQALLSAHQDFDQEVPANTPHSSLQSPALLQ